MKIEIIKNRSVNMKMLFKVGALLTLTVVVSCKKFVQVPPPTTQLAASTVFSNNSTATSAVINIYSQMDNAFAYPTSLFAGLSADELANYSTDPDLQQIYVNGINATFNGTVSSLWISNYKYIYQANAIIEGLQQNKGTTAGANRQLTGEAKFLRAFFHLYLTNFYGDVPLVLSTDFTVTSKLARTPKLQVLQQVITDLQDAESKLNSNYVDISDTLATSERVRPNKSAAAALLARAYLYLGDYSKDPSNYKHAEDQATSVLTNSTYALSQLTGASSVFKKNSTETIWSLQTVLPTDDYATAEGDNFIMFNGSTNIGISQQLLNSFETNDQRKVNWIGSFTGTSPAFTYYFPYKYKDQYASSASEYSVVLRLAEQYLIRAEARVEQGNTNGALADLNIIRNRAGLPNYAGLTDKASLLAAVFHERQVELFSEWGHRWFDLIRKGFANSVMGSPGNVCQSKGGLWNSNWQLYPIPQLDRTNDPNLTQNPGY
jgi:hypothetical protein